MKKQSYPLKQITARAIVILLIVAILVSCQLLPQNSNESIDRTETSSATQTSRVETSAALETTPALPPIFQTATLNRQDTPHSYTEETCRYLRNKWNPLNAEPGTVVMVILIKNINTGTAALPDSVSVVEFLEMMQQLKSQGFEAIDAKQLQAFMERNVEIPARSVLLVQDGNQSRDYYDKYFGEYFVNWGWTVVNGWVSEPNVDLTLLEENRLLETEGLVDHQARGVTAETKLSDESAKSVLARELQGSLDGFADHFAKTPTMIIWPNGGFGIRPVAVARQLRFKIGFTSNSRGPIMYNWVPLADATDPQRPGLIPEGMINDPLMTLPTYSPNEVLAALDVVRIIGKEAASYAMENKEAEHSYYEIVCEEEYGPMPTP